MESAWTVEIIQHAQEHSSATDEETVSMEIVQLYLITSSI